ncbi:hypothetical protein CCACVL1_22978 [Corchorus capsularis]|uniref:Uncharacterized protein n=1 Tax=Corchorus capsularis TaxID=210143 RepID=A0A1R3GVS0_COCAP|nr:hypothetical protein CCACVL1_22978 [Corchorus capsularis]
MAQENEREAADQDAEMESNNFVQDDVGLDEMDVSTTPSMFSKRRRKSGEFEPISADCIISAAKLIGDGIGEAGKDLNMSIGSEMVIQEKVQELDIILGEIDGLTEEERDIALSKIWITLHKCSSLVAFRLTENLHGSGDFYVAIKLA